MRYMDVLNTGVVGVIPKHPKIEELISKERLDSIELCGQAVKGAGPIYASKVFQGADYLKIKYLPG